MHLILTLALAGSIVTQAVDSTVKPLMAKDGIPGMAVGIIVDGKPSFFYYGIADKQTSKPVSASTIFEVGSISKTFTATLTSYAQLRGFLSLSDKVDKYFPALQGSPFGDVTLLNLGTHTAGNLPLQVPDGIDNDDQLVAYLKAFRSSKPMGTMRVYSNIGIGTLGLIVAKSMHEDFTALVEGRLFPALGLTSTFIDVPPEKMADYAQGYTTKNETHRATPGELGKESYGVHTTAPDLARFLQINMGAISVDDTMQRAVMQTHTGYYTAGPMTQDLIWEQYPLPMTLSTLQAGTGLDPTDARQLSPPLPPQSNVWINKTGSTNGFGAYVAFIPSKRMGIVLLANKYYSLDERVTAAYHILTTLTR